MIAPINSMLVALAGPTDRTFEFSVEFRLRALSEEKLDKLQKALS